MSIETFGSILKEEQVKTVERGIIPNTFVLENLGLFPGYYGSQLPTDVLPDSLFLVMPMKESTEKILRLTHIIRKQSGIDFEGSPASICIGNTTLECIRIRDIKSFEQIGEIQSYYRDLGIKFSKTRPIDELGLIKVKKVFNLTFIDDKILKDNERNMYYLKIDKQLSWSLFKKVTLQLRSNINLSAFDAALAVVYGAEVYDLIRIFTEKLSIDDLHLLNSKYQELIKLNFA